MIFVQIDRYEIETDEVTESFLDGEGAYLIPNDGRVWEITIDDSGVIIYDNVAVNTECNNEGEYKNLNTESPLVDRVKLTEPDTETNLCEEEEIADKDVESNLIIDEEQITVPDAETELFDEEVTVETDVLSKDNADEENTEEIDIINLSDEETPEELESVTPVVEQTVNINMKRNPLNEEISTELHAEHYSHTLTHKSDNILNNQSAEKNNLSNNSQNINQHKLNVPTDRKDRSEFNGGRSLYACNS